MRSFELITDKEKVVFNFPTSLQEISEKFLSDVTDTVKVANDYTLVGIIYREKLGNIILTRKQAKKSFTAGVIPIFIKAGKSDSDFLDGVKIKDKLIISSSDLSIGHHVSCPNNSLSLDVFINHLDRDTTVAARYKNNYGGDQCYFVDFKLVPNCAIKGFYSKSTTLQNDEYITILPLNDSNSDDSDDLDF